MQKEGAIGGGGLGGGGGDGGGLGDGAGGSAGVCPATSVQRPSKSRDGLSLMDESVKSGEPSDGSRTKYSQVGLQQAKGL